MSPIRLPAPSPPRVSAAVGRFWLRIGSELREARTARHLTVSGLAERAGVSRWLIYDLERGEACSIEAVSRLADALGLRIDGRLVDPKRSDRQVVAQMLDPVHSAMGEFEARWLRGSGFGTGIDEPYQHYQFAGRADFVAWHVDDRALLHIENRTRFPDFQDAAGSFNAKRAYLGRALAERLGVNRWESETHVVAGLWSAEVLHVLRLRTESFRSLCPDSAKVFDDWWRGRPLIHGRQSVFVLLDPLAGQRRRQFVGLDDALHVRPRYRGYAEAASAIMQVA